MCHINQGPDWSAAGWAPGKRHPGPTPIDPQILDDQNAAIAAGAATADLKRRRAASALQAGSRGVIGQPSALQGGSSASAGSRTSSGGLSGRGYGSTALGGGGGAGR